MNVSRNTSRARCCGEVRGKAEMSWKDSWNGEGVAEIRGRTEKVKAK
jgi:hypothetical protein